MPLPISKQQFNKLGERIAAGDPPAKEDLQSLNEVLRAYQAILVTVEERLSLIGLPATSRVKTRGVLIEKLRREQGMALARVQDLAGARTVIGGGWAEQDAIVARLKSHFDEWTGKPSKIVDRRLQPSHGYRAVHLIVFPEGVPVEIQVRTELQNYWAQLVERLADRWGRGIRYGEDPKEAHLPVEGVKLTDGSPVTRQRIIDDLRNIADQIANLELTEKEITEARRKTLVSLEERISNEFGRSVTDLESDAIRFYPRLRYRFKAFVSSFLGRAAGRPTRSALLPQRHRRRAGRLIRRTVPDVPAPDADFVRAKLRDCNSFVDSVGHELRSRLQLQLDTLRDTLQSLGEYVEQGGIK